MNDKDHPPYLETVEDQYERAQRQHSQKQFVEGEMAKVYFVFGVRRMKVNKVYDTPVKHVKLYELKSADGSYYFATKEFMEKIY